jgi:hypothetical protein
MLADQATIGAEGDSDRKAGTAIYLRAYGRHLLREHDGERVRIQRIIHRVLEPPRFRPAEMQSWSLTHPNTYSVDVEVVVQRSDLEREAVRVGQNASDRRSATGGWSSGGVR